MRREGRVLPYHTLGQERSINPVPQFLIYCYLLILKYPSQLCAMLAGMVDAMGCALAIERFIMSKRNQYTTSWCRIIDDVSKDDDEELSLPASVLDKFINNDLSATAQLVYFCLCFNAPVDTETFSYDVDAIADTLKKSTRTIYKALADLKEANLIDIERAIGGILV